LAANDGSSYGAGGGAEPIVPKPVPTEAAPLTAMASPETSNSDPSTLILGLPEEGTGGQVITTNAPEPAPVWERLSPNTLWMIGLGSLSVLLGAMALIFRRR
jgi:hypothetical protein